MEVTRVDSRKPSEWSRDDRDRTVTREALWYELDMLQRRVNTQLSLLGRRGEQVSKYPDVPRRHPVVNPMAVLFVVLSVVSWAIVITALLIDRS
jgi:hypothetical protein